MGKIMGKIMGNIKKYSFLQRRGNVRGWSNNLKYVDNIRTGK